MLCLAPASLAMTVLPMLFPMSGGALSADVKATDTAAIEWILPGDFDQARARAVRDQRIIVIKGISFGVDNVGATCATKGRW